MRGVLAKHFTKQERLSTVALQNEQVTRSRVDRIEELLSRRFWGRLKWLFFGR